LSQSCPAAGQGTFAHPADVLDEVKIASRVGFGVLLLLLGGVWMGQGLGYIPGSFMTGEMRWFWIGLGCAVVGRGLVGLGIRARRAPG